MLDLVGIKVHTLTQAQGGRAPKLAELVLLDPRATPRDDKHARDDTGDLERPF